MRRHAAPNRVADAFHPGPAILHPVNDSPTPAGPPAEITHLVRERTEARTRHDWTRADALKAEIEAAGWRVVDRGSRTSITPGAPPTVAVEGEVRYGAARFVPSLLEEPATTKWTVVVMASEQPDQFSRLLGALKVHAPAGTQVIVVANDPSEAQAAGLAPEAADREPVGGVEPEVLRTSTRVGYAAALNIGLQRARGEFVLMANGTAWPTGDAMTPLAAALADPGVAASGGYPLHSDAQGPLRPNALSRELAAATAGGDGDAAGGDDATAGTTPQVVALEGAWLAFRRDDYRELGPLDERFVTPAWLDVWWTLRLRAGAEPEGAQYQEPAEAADRPIRPTRPSRTRRTGQSPRRPHHSRPAPKPTLQTPVGRFSSSCRWIARKCRGHPIGRGSTAATCTACSTASAGARTSADRQPPTSILSTGPAAAPRAATAGWVVGVARPYSWR